MLLSVHWKVHWKWFFYGTAENKDKKKKKPLGTFIFKSVLEPDKGYNSMIKLKIIIVLAHDKVWVYVFAARLLWNPMCINLNNIFAKWNCALRHSSMPKTCTNPEGSREYWWGSKVYSTNLMWMYYLEHKECNLAWNRWPGICSPEKPANTLLSMWDFTC